MEKTICLNKDTPSVLYLCNKDKRLAKVISMVGEIEYIPHRDDPYAFVIHEIIEQMLSIKVAAKIYERVKNLCQGEVTPKNISRLSDDEIKSTGMSGQKVSYIRSFTDSVLSKKLILDDLSNLPDEEVCSRLFSIRGIGNWTVKMYLIFVLDRQDILPIEDMAFLQAYKWVYKTNDISKGAVEKKCRKWKPYSSIASRFLYRAQDMGFTKKEFHLYK